MSKFLNRILISCLFIFLTGTLAVAQSSTATLTGIVEDTNGQVIPSATVTISDLAKGFERRAVTNDNGSFTFIFLPASTYSILVEQTGFGRAQVENVVLNVGDQKALQIQLKVGDVKAAIEVTAESPLVDTDAKVGLVVNRDFIERTPIQGRSFQALIALTPGVVIVNGGTPNSNGQFSVNGQRPGANAFLVDGVSGNVSAAPPGINATSAAGGNLPGLSQLGTTHPMAGIEELQEFAVQTSTYGAEYGRQPGGQISISTRGGTNQLHGAVFEYVRNEKFDANDWFANSLGNGRTVFRQNQFGGTINGPVFLPNIGDGGPRWYNGRNRTFFFFNYEGLRLMQPRFAIVDVPSMCLRGLGSSCTIARAHTSLLPVVRAFPVPNGPDLALPNGQPSGWARFSAAYSNPSELDQTSIRIDQSFGTKANAFVRYNRTPSSAVTRSEVSPHTLLSQTNLTRSLTAGVTSLISPHLSNDARFSWSAADTTVNAGDDGFGGAIPVTDRTVVIPAAIELGDAFVNLGFSFPGTSGVARSTLVHQNSFSEQRSINLVDTVSFVAGAHQMKFGVDYRHLAPTVGVTDGFSMGINTLAGVQNGTLSSLSWAVNRLGEPRYWNLSAFGQDTWKATKRLTLTLGLRWEFNPPPTEANAKSPLAVDQIEDLATMRLEPIGTKVWGADYNNLAPRFGVAYQLIDDPGSETVLRGGFGVYYDTGNEHSSRPFISSFPFRLNQSYTGAALQQIPLNPALVVRPTVPIDGTFPAQIPTTFIFDPELELPYTLQWNLSAERSLGKSQSLTVSYVGAAGRKLLQMTQKTISSINPRFSTVSVTRNNATSDYHALQANFQRRLSKGFMAIASYTWAHAIDDDSVGDGFSAPQRGNSSFDVRHVFAGAASYDLPKPKFGSFLGLILRDWSADTRVQIQSAAPINVVAGTFPDPATGDLVSIRPNVIPGVPIYIFGDEFPGGRIVNNATYTAADNAMLLAAGCLRVARALGEPTSIPIGPARGAFCSPPALTQGNLGRNVLRGLPMWQVDVSLRREFQVRERVRVQLRADAFNVFNHPNFGSITSSNGLTNPSFGQATQMANRALGGLNQLYQIGGPRSLQFSARVSF